MSGYYYSQQSTPDEEDDFDFNQPFQNRTQQNMQQQPSHQSYTAQSMSPTIPQGSMYGNPQQFYQQPQQYMPSQQMPQQYPPQRPQQQQAQQYQGYRQSTQYWPQYHYLGPQGSPFVPTPTVPSNYPTYDTQTVTPFPPYTEAATTTPRMTSAGPSGTTSAGYLSPDEASRTRPSRTTSHASSSGGGARGDRSYSHSSMSAASTRSVSPALGEMQRWGTQNEDGTWRCRYPGCASRSSFQRGCDLRKHYKRHTKSLFCRVEGCPQSTEGGFSSKKDRARHEAKHNPSVVCEWEGCERLFSRVDNMKDHVRRVHRRQGHR